MAYKAALFDLDGVVVDTESQYTKFWGSVGKKYFPEQPDFAEKIKGSTLVQIYDRYFKGETDKQQTITKGLDDFERSMDYEYIPGYYQFVLKLRELGVKTAVVTSSNIAKMENVYRAHPDFKSLFDAILTSEDFDKSKPDPDCYLKAAQRFGFQSDECVGFEDSINGLKAVKAAKMMCVGLATTNSEEVVAQYADIVIDNYLSDSVNAREQYNKMIGLFV
jgi:beta-phosphoglucomutase